MHGILRQRLIGEVEAVLPPAIDDFQKFFVSVFQRELKYVVKFMHGLGMQYGKPAESADEGGCSQSQGADQVYSPAVVVVPTVGITSVPQFNGEQTDAMDDETRAGVKRDRGIAGVSVLRPEQVGKHTQAACGQDRQRKQLDGQGCRRGFGQIQQSRGHAHHHEAESPGRLYGPERGDAKPVAWKGLFHAVIADRLEQNQHAPEDEHPRQAGADGIHESALRCRAVRMEQRFGAMSARRTAEGKAGQAKSDGQGEIQSIKSLLMEPSKSLRRQQTRKFESAQGEQAQARETTRRE
ncbi:MULTISPECIES: hypothetical protein [Methylococcus]|uniref:Uncharacterized protein n=1 Tax=Methylococcus capsulatus TaxID=414 RepID=A0ABZ2F2N7_METCP|nr:MULTISPECIES: hypothetical protein [Methylococcus]